MQYIPQATDATLGVLPHTERPPAYSIWSPGKTAVTLPPLFPVQTTRATVLFADMRGYTGLAEQLPPARVVPLLDEFFGVLASATEAYGGEVFHMAGDGMMAGFGVRDPGHQGGGGGLPPARAVQRRFLFGAPVAGRVVGRGRNRCRVASGGSRIGNARTAGKKNGDAGGGYGQC